ncbi:MAG: DUF523 and DUF1722 domain-containing protein [Spirochaetales bacterium]|nr:DUF523 and DUF1722 domain-containing protein [Spirochaetales bacterium]
MDKIKVGVSSCLLGNKVRFNSQHKLDHYIADVLGQWFDFVPVCPEVECGLPVPRETMRLVGNREQQKLMTSLTGIDHTEKMEKWIQKKLPELEQENLMAFIFKTKSPSSGMRKVKIYNEKGNPVSYDGEGLFAKAFMQRFPDIPVEDEGRLKDNGIREQFIESIFILDRWRQAVSERKSSSIVEFHTRHKYTFMAHSPEFLKAMGKLTAAAGNLDINTLIQEYRKQLNNLLREKKTKKTNYNVLLHILGYFKKNLTPEEKQELLRECELYYNGYSPLIVPLTLLRHYTGKYKESYLIKQYFLNPHPAELGLLNHI